MNKEFHKFKKKILREHLIKSLMFGISASAILTSLLYIALKRIPITIHLVLYILVFAIFAFIFSSMWFKYRLPNDKTIAKRLDKTFSLDEKVQTMIEFEGVNNDILKRQKEDVTNSLKNLPETKLPFKVSFVYFGVVIVAAIFVLSSCFVPYSKPREQNNPSINPSTPPSLVSPNSGDLTFDDSIDDFITSLEDLINNSNAEEAVKQGMLEIIDKLEENLKNATTLDEQVNAIKDAIVKIDELINRFNSKDKIGESLILEPNQNLVDLGNGLISSDISAIEEALYNLNQEFLNLTEESELISSLEDVKNQISEALDNSGVSNEDELYQALKNLLTSLNDIARQLENQEINLKDAQETLEVVIEEAKNAIIDDVTIQISNQELANIIKEYLESLISSEPGKDDGDNDDSQNNEGEDGEDEEDKNGDDTVDPDEGDEEDPDNPDVGGDGETVYGNDDTIYSDKGHSEYGDVIDEYYDKIVEEESSGETPEDISDALADYFGSLYH